MPVARKVYSLHNEHWCARWPQSKRNPADENVFGVSGGTRRAADQICKHGLVVHRKVDLFFNMQRVVIKWAWKGHLHLFSILVGLLQVDFGIARFQLPCMNHWQPKTSICLLRHGQTETCNLMDQRRPTPTKRCLARIKSAAHDGKCSLRCWHGMPILQQTFQSQLPVPEVLPSGSRSECRTCAKP